MFYDRTGGAKSARNQQVSGTKEYPGPIYGWVKGISQSAAKPGMASFLQNIFPTKRGGRLRKGSITRATIGDPVTHLASYDGATPKLFAFTAAAIYDATAPADPLVALSSVVSGLTNGNWSSLQFTPSGGTPYLVAANDAGQIRRYNGTAWLTEAGSPAITNSANICHVWNFKRFLWGFRKGSLTACYLPVGQIGGAFADFDLTGVFSKGGELIIGATWSLNAGNGLQDVCVFGTSKGEFAIYEGLTPADMKLANVYQMGTPLNKISMFRAGGDIAILMNDGAIPISASISNDRAALKGKLALTTPIEPEWQKIIRSRSEASTRFPVTLWQKKGMVIIGLPAKTGEATECLVANAIDGTWSKFTGWDVNASCVFNDRFYFGTTDGLVKEGDTGGNDDGAAYHCVYVPYFSTLGTPAEKAALHARVHALVNFPFSVQMFGCADYKVDLPNPLAPDGVPEKNQWDVGEWDNNTFWGGGDEATEGHIFWQSVYGFGTSLAPGLSVNIEFSEGEPEFEILGLDLQWEGGKVITG